ncbi:MAG TPA: hypothetical protein PLN76_09690 [Saprospiraceae bacterium]|nr:hypothetical protein [Saprospiraceae bacterium]
MKILVGRINTFTHSLPRHILPYFRTMDPHILSLTEENYLKAIYNLSEQSPDSSTSTNEVAQLI